MSSLPFNGSSPLPHDRERSGLQSFHCLARRYIELAAHLRCQQLTSAMRQARKVLCHRSQRVAESKSTSISWSSSPPSHASAALEVIALLAARIGQNCGSAQTQRTFLYVRELECKMRRGRMTFDVFRMRSRGSFQ
eukprot:2773733-Amphidinium_carterae.1